MIFWWWFGYQKPQVLGFGTLFWKCHREMGERQVEHGFSSLFAILNDFSKSSVPNVLKTLKTSITKYPPNFGKKWIKALFNLPWTHFSADFGHPIRHYWWHKIKSVLYVDLFCQTLSITIIHFCFSITNFSFFLPWFVLHDRMFFRICNLCSNPLIISEFWNIRIGTGTPRHQFSRKNHIRDPIPLRPNDPSLLLTMCRFFSFSV